MRTNLSIFSLGNNKISKTFHLALCVFLSNTTLGSFWKKGVTTSLTLLLLVFGIFLHAQTNPTAQNLPYSQNFGTTTFTSMPAGMAAWSTFGSNLTTQANAEASTPGANATITAQTASTTTGGIHGYAVSSNAQAYIQQSGNATNGTNQIVAAINTGTNTSVNLAYDLSLINGGTTTQDFGHAVQYRAGTSGSWTTISGSAMTFGAVTTYTTTTRSFTVTGLTASTIYQFRWIVWRPTGSSSSKGIGVDNISISAATSSPTISSAGTLAAVNTTYGTASATPTSFNVSGTGMTEGILVTPPSGYEVSLASASGYASTVTVGAAGTISSTPVYVRLTATATVSGSPYSGNIVLSSTGATSVNVATISSSVAAKELTITGITADTKIYDAITTASLTGTAAYAGLENGETFTVTGTPSATFDNKNVGTGKAVTVTGYTAPSTNYTVTQPSLTADITAFTLTTTGASASNKIYDATNIATITGASLVGVISPDDVTLVPSGTFAQSSIGTAIVVTSTSTLTGADATNYTLTQPSGLTADITAKGLTISGVMANNKVFDGTTTATLSGTPALVGVLAADLSNVTLDATSVVANFDNANVGTGKPVTVTGYAITGSASTNYTLSQPSGLTADISAGAVPSITSTLTHTVTYGTAAAVYTITASENPTSFNATGLPAGLSINTSNGEITGTPTASIGNYNVSITASNANGSSTPAILVYTITAKALTVTGATVQSKVYDRTTAATYTGTLNGIFGADVVTLDGTGTYASFAVANGIAVTSTATLSGANAGNYTLTQPTGLTGDITPKDLSVTNTSVTTKVYDGTTAATLTGSTLVGVIAPDDVMVSGNGTFSTKNVGVGIAVTSALTLSGVDAANYTVSQPSGLTGEITPATLTVSGLSGVTKLYDGTTSASISGTPSLNGIIMTDVVTIDGTPTSTFDNKNVGTAKTITVAGYTLTGADAGNYVLATVTTTGDITKAPLTISSAAAQNKQFDGTTNAVITGTLAGIISPDVVTLVGTGTFASSAVGNGIAVTSTSTLAGADAGNYEINPQPSGLTANITPGPTVLAVGDLTVLGFNSNAPDNFAFVTWVALEDNTYIKFSDNGFLSNASANAASNVRGGENFVIWRNNTGTSIPAGTVISIQDGTPATTNTGSIVSGSLSGLSSSGDQIFAYQGPAVSGSNPDYTANTNPTTFNGTMIYGLNFASNWLSTGTTSANTSYLPSELNVPNGNIALTTASTTRGEYTGSRSNQCSLNDYKALVNNPANWTTATSAGTITLNTTPFTLDPCAPTITGGTLTPSSLTTTYGTASSNATFDLSGINMTAGISVTPPVGFEVSTTIDFSANVGNNASPITVGAAGTIASTTIYARILPTATVAASPYSGDIVLSSSGATSVNVAIANSTVNAKGLTITGITADNKIYDGNTTASISGTAAYASLENGESFTVTGTPSATFDNKNVGTGKAVTVSGYTAPSTNYTVTQPSLTADITPLALTTTGAMASNKIYDGTNTAAITGASLVGVISPDDVSLVPSGTFAQINVGTIIVVTSTSTLTGADATNYTLTQPSGLTADITPKSLTITGVIANNKAFDGTTTATLSGTPALVGVLAADLSNVTLDATSVVANFDNANVGTGKPVTVTGYAITGSASTNYTLSQPSGLTADISAGAVPSITSALTHTTTYGTAAAVYTITASENPTSFNATGLPAGLSINTSNGEITGTPTASIGNYNITITASNVNGSSTPAILVYTITAKALTVSSATVQSKVYDRTTAATYTGTLNGIFGTDVVTLNGTGTYASFTVANGIAVTSTATLSGADAGNYTLTQPTGLTGDITPKDLTVTNTSVTTKVYDGTTAATLTGSTLVGVIAPDDVMVSGNGTFSTKNVGVAIAVTSALTLSGVDAANYTVTQPSGLTGDITKAELTVNGLTGENKIYDATTTAIVTGMPSLNGIIGAEVVTLDGTATFTFNNKNVGLSKIITISGYTLGGADAGNYMLKQPLATADVTVAALAISAATAQNKQFDGTTDAIITGTLTGILLTDDVTLVGTGTFASSAIGNGIAVTSTSTLAGADAGNYEINPQPSGLTANITAPPTTLTAGDVAVIGYNTSGTPDNFAIVILRDLEQNTEFFISDNEVAVAGGTSFADLGEGEASFKVKAGQTIAAGTVIVLPWGAAAVSTATYDWSATQTIVGANTNNFGLNNGPADEIYIYQASDITSLTPSQFVFHCKLGGTGQIPAGLTLGTTAIAPTGAALRYKTTGALYTGCKQDLLTAIGNTASNWVVTGATTLAAGDWTFTVLPTCSPVITSSTLTLPAFSTTYGTSSTSSTFNISGLNMAAGISLDPPAGFQLSTVSDFSSNVATNGSPIVVGEAGTIASTPIYVRLMATATVAASPYSGDIMLSSASATNVNVAIASSTVSAKGLTISGVTADNKLYDATTSATLAGTPSYVGLENGETFSVSGTATATFDNKNVGTAKTVTVTGYTAPSTNYTLTQPSLTADITPITLTLSGITGVNKTYDGNTDASLAGMPVLNGVLSGEDVSYSGIVTSTFDNKNIGVAKPITVSGFVLMGADAGNYTLTQPTGITANITAKNITIAGITANNKLFDGNTIATLAGTPSLVGVVAGDVSNVTLDASSVMANFDNANVGTNKPVTVSGYAITGSESSNYSLTQPTGLTADITAGATPVITSTLTHSATYGMVANVYTITASESPLSFNATGLPAGLSINTTNGEITGTPTGNAGNYNVSLTATNIHGTSNAAILVYTIAPKVLTVTSPVAQDKVYDRTNAATFTGTLVGVVGTDVVTLNGTGTFAQITVGSGIAVTSTATLAGANAASYTLTQPSGLAANITKAPLTISSAAAQNKIFDGNTDAVITGTLSGVVAPDVVTLVGTGTFASSAIGTGIAVTSTCTLAGTDAANYEINPQPTGLTADILPSSTPPTCSITSPANNAIFYYPNNATIQVDATDSDGIAKVEFFRNGVKIGEDLTAPYSFVLVNNQMGTFTITAKATDNVNDFTTSSPIDLIMRCYKEDINNNGAVNVNDLLSMLTQFGLTCNGCPQDINGDGTVNVNDLLSLLSKFGLSCN